MKGKIQKKLTAMLNQNDILKRAHTSSFWRAVLNWWLNRMIPFNKPHGFAIREMEDYRITVLLPYKRKNFNHIKGLHACAMATVSEFTTGFLLVSRLDPRKYRLIMKRLEMEYHYQGKMNAYAEFSISEEWLNENVHSPLTSHDSVDVQCVVKIYDEKSNHLTTGTICWQIKDWTKVKTKGV
jgi:acyl-coenzyme A thioesterase PaaI-like protein